MSGSSNLVVFGYDALNSNTQSFAVVLGTDVANQNGGADIIAIGHHTLNGNTGSSVIAIGLSAGVGNTGDGVVIIGDPVGHSNTGNNLVAIGTGTGSGNTGNDLVAVGLNAGVSNTGASVVALGTSAASGNAGTHVYAVGENAGLCNTTSSLIATGWNAASMSGATGIENYAWQSILANGVQPIFFGMGNYGIEWRSVASSADGSNLIAAAWQDGALSNGWTYGRVWLSKDSGVTWVDQSGTPTYHWTSVASDYSGNRLLAATASSDGDGFVWTSSNGGGTWSNYSSALGSAYWQGVAVSSNGNTMVVGDESGSNGVFLTSNAGTTWQYQSDLSGFWRRVAISADASIVVAGDISENDGAGGNLWIATLSAGQRTWARWNAVDPYVSGRTATGYWEGIAISSNGQYIYAVTGSSTSWRSSDYGSNWMVMNVNTSGDFFDYILTAVACSADGSTVFLADVPESLSSGRVWTSSNFGASFVSNAQSPHISWSALATDASATRIVGVGSNAFIAISSVASNVVALGENAGLVNVGSHVIAIGSGAGLSNSAPNVVAIGNGAGVRNGNFTGSSDNFESQLYQYSGMNGSNLVAIGTGAGSNNYATNAIMIGEMAGAGAVGSNIVAIGSNAYSNGNAVSGVFIGENAGSNIGRYDVELEGGYAVISIGSNAGVNDDTNESVNIGMQAGYNNQASESINIGSKSGIGNSSVASVNIGYNAGGGLDDAEWQNNETTIYTNGVAISYTGEYMYSVGGDQVGSSSNYGSYSFTQTLGTDMRGIACSGNGCNVFTCDSNGYLYFSSNGGSTFQITVDASGSAYIGRWRGVAMSRGPVTLIENIVGLPYTAQMFACESGGEGTGYIWSSSNGGRTFAIETVPGMGDWGAIACDAQGGYVIAGDQSNSNLWVRDPSHNWKNVTTMPDVTNEDQSNIPLDYFTAVAISANGKFMYAAGTDYGRIWASSNYGSNWAYINDDGAYWTSLACSEDGQTLHAASSDVWDYNGGRIWSTTIDGTSSYPSWTRTPRAPKAAWMALACDNTGLNLTAGAAGESANNGTWFNSVPFRRETVAIGTNSLYNNIGNLAIGIGSNAGSENNGSDTVYIGSEAGRHAFGDYSIGIGSEALLAGMYPNCVAIGSSALRYNGTSNSNGVYVQNYNTEGSIAIGDHAGESNGYDSNSTFLVAIGSYAGHQQTGSSNIAIGSNAGRSSRGSCNVYIGTSAGSNMSGANNNICIGANAYAQERSGCIVFGDSLTASIYPVSNNTFLVTSADGSNVYLNGSREGGGGAGGCTLGIGCTPAYTLDICGDVHATGTFYSDLNAFLITSDRTVKQNVSGTSLGLAFVNALVPVDYAYTSVPDVTHHGLIAQDLQSTLASSGLSGSNTTVVSENPVTKKLGINYIELIAPLVKAVQELSAEVETLKAQVARLSA